MDRKANSKVTAVAGQTSGQRKPGSVEQPSGISTVDTLSSLIIEPGQPAARKELGRRN